MLITEHCKIHSDALRGFLSVFLQFSADLFMCDKISRMRSNNASVKYYVKLPDNGNVMCTIRSDRYIMSTKLSSTGVLSLRSFQKRQKTDKKPQIGW